MKKKMFKLVLISCALVSVMVSMTACVSNKAETKAENKPLAVAVVLGQHENSQAINLNSDFVKKPVIQAVSSFGFVSVISADGEPNLVTGKTYEVKEQYKGNPGLLQELAEKESITVLQEMEDVRANDPEVDTLESLRLAVRTFDSAPEGATKEILIIDTGLSTAGILNFQNNLINAEPDTVVRMLSEKKSIPNLDGVTVRWQQMGDVEAPQKELTPAQAENLRAIWKAIVEEGGGIFEAKDVIANPGKVSGNLPPVSTVELPAETAIKFAPKEVKDYSKPIFLSEEQVKFIPDSDEYIDENAANDVIKPVADYMKKNRGFKMLLVGTTAGDTNSAFSINLSKRRAETVKSSLISMGVPKDRIVCIGLGCSDPWHIPNVGTGDGMASNNRKVVLIDANSDIAKSLMK